METFENKIHLQKLLILSNLIGSSSSTKREKTKKARK